MASNTQSSAYTIMNSSQESVGNTGRKEKTVLEKDHNGSKQQPCPEPSLTMEDILTHKIPASCSTSLGPWG